LRYLYLRNSQISQQNETLTETIEDQESLRRRIAELETGHGDLDGGIDQISEEAPFDRLQVQRFKKRKLVLKDEIQTLRSRPIPDNIA
jgi:hypothetical protein